MNLVQSLVAGNANCAGKYRFLKFRYSQMITSKQVQSFEKHSCYNYGQNLISFGNSRGNSQIPCLLIITTLRFTSSKKNIWLSIKKSQNIMSMIVELISGTVLELKNEELTQSHKIWKKSQQRQLNTSFEQMTWRRIWTNSLCFTTYLI